MPTLRSQPWVIEQDEEAGTLPNLVSLTHIVNNIQESNRFPQVVRYTRALAGVRLLRNPCMWNDQKDGRQQL